MNTTGPRKPMHAFLTRGMGKRNKDGTDFLRLARLTTYGSGVTVFRSGNYATDAEAEDACLRWLESRKNDDVVLAEFSRAKNRIVEVTPDEFRARRIADAAKRFEERIARDRQQGEELAARIERDRLIADPTTPFLDWTIARLNLSPALAAELRARHDATTTTRSTP